MDKQNIVHPYNGILSSNKKNEIPILAITCLNFESVMHEKSQSQKATCCDSICMKCP